MLVTLQWPKNEIYNLNKGIYTKIVALDDFKGTQNVSLTQGPILLNNKPVPDVILTSRPLIMHMRSPCCA